MSEVILKIENLSKQYRLGLVGTGSLGDDLKRWWFKIRGKDDPFLKIGETNDRSKKGTSEYVWALKDINLEVKKGEVLGVIGKNGAGKSTLLKILSKVTGPTTGTIKSKGRIASLLEVGTGFHPELTGKENIYLNGAILGMTKAEINAKYEEIVAFSGCERYIDTPVKRYSSGMRVRLAFAVAAFLEPDILVIDEVLAVGDAEFQKKAIGKMQDISKGEGRTVLFVSHNMAAVRNLCTRAIVLNNGLAVFEGNVNDSISYYLRKKKSMENIKFPVRFLGGEILDFKILDFIGNSSNLLLGEKCSFNLRIKLKTPELVKINIRYQIFDKEDRLITTFNTFHFGMNKVLHNDVQSFICQISKLKISPGLYDIGLQILDLNTKEVLYHKNTFAEIFIETGDVFKTGKLPSKRNLGVFLSEQLWQVK